MVKRLGVLTACLLLCGGLGVLATPAAASDVLDRPLPLSILLPRLLDNSTCSSSGSGPLGPTTGKLGAFCDSIPATSTGAGAFTSIENRTGGSAEEAIRKRQERLRGGGGASADGNELGGGFGMFVTTEYGSLNKSTSMFELGYEQNTAAGTVGLDYAFRRAVVGLAFNYQHEFGDFAGQTGGYNNDLYSIILYGTVTPLPNLFVDLNAGYTRKQYNIDRRVSLQAQTAPQPGFLGRIEGDTHSNDFNLGARIGYDLRFGALTVGPRVGANYRESALAGFQETGDTGIEMIYGDQTIVSLTTNVGLFTSYAISTGFGVVVPQLTGEWIHEFANDQRTVPFTFVNATSRPTFRYLTEGPDRDYFTIGAGAVVQLPSGLTPFINYVEVLDYKRREQRTVTLGLRFGF